MNGFYFIIIFIYIIEEETEQGEKITQIVESFSIILIGRIEIAFYRKIFYKNIKNLQLIL